MPEATVHPPPDQNQRDRIAKELDTTMLVEAAAGTGKTTSMIGRMVALLESGRCRSVEHMAAVTFTRKAAAELRARFQVALEKRAASAEGSARKNLGEAASHIERCFIGTIHSFCARLLRERPVFFIDLVRAFPDTPYRTLLLAWGEVRERHKLARDEEGHYLLPPEGEGRSHEPRGKSERPKSEG